MQLPTYHERVKALDKVTLSLLQLVRDQIGAETADQIEQIGRDDDGLSVSQSLAVAALINNGIRVPDGLAAEFKRVSELEYDMEDYEDLLEAQKELD